jgi:GH24 family phage-related lysozyme (muramidase)
MKDDYTEYKIERGEQDKPSPFLSPKFIGAAIVTMVGYNYIADKMRQRDPLSALDTPQTDEQFSVLDIGSSDEQKQQRTIDKADQAGHNLFKYVILETKRREAMGRPGKELTSYMDGDSPAIGYGNRIKYLSPEWQRTVEEQGYMVTEDQARQMMYQTFEQLEKTVKQELPHLQRHELWAVQSLAFNWGMGNVKRSALWKHLKAGDKTGETRRAWMRCHAGTDNHRTSRKFEWALYTGDFDTAKKYADSAYESLRKRGDFKHYGKK